jgi:hypothetical protein
LFSPVPYSIFFFIIAKIGNICLVLPAIIPKNKSSNLERGWKIYFLKRSNFAANQLVSKMEIITFESKAYKELDNKITAIADYIFNHMEAESTNEDEIWVDSYEVCTFLKISEVKRMLEERLIRSNKENIQDLITNHQLHVKERRNLRKNK